MLHRNAPFLAHNNHFRAATQAGPRRSRECLRLPVLGKLYGQTDLVTIQRMRPVAIDLDMPAVGQATKCAYLRSTLNCAKQFHVRSLVGEARPLGTEANEKGTAGHCVGATRDSDAASLSPTATPQPTQEQLLEYQRKLSDNFRPLLRGKRVVCLGIPDEYEFMQPELVDLLEVKVGRYLR